MDNSVKVSVIIAVYNAEKFVTKAVESALSQPETAEVILIEDGSPDKSLEVCEGLASKNDKVFLYRHPGGLNKGAPASFNIGMKKAFCEYLAILGADDYFLPGRFVKAKQIFMNDPDCDGVYEAIGSQFENKWIEDQFIIELGKLPELITINEVIKPEDLFKILIAPGYGYFSLDGLVIKKAILAKSGFFNEELFLHQDSEFIYRLGAIARLRPGTLDEPVAMRLIHNDNRIFAKRSIHQIYEDKMKMWMSTYRWLQEKGLKEKGNLVYDEIIKYYVNMKPFQWYWLNKLPREFRQIINSFLLLFEKPEVILRKIYWRKIFSINILSVFVRNARKIKCYKNILWK